MENKLKCWKKTKDTNTDVIFDKSNSPEQVFVFQWKARKRWYVDGNKIDSPFPIKESIGKNKALSYAKSYMKKNDNC